nr:15779_t:CDS:2 [Entrophospora candida]
MISISVCTCIIVLYLNIYGECKEEYESVLLVIREFYKLPARTSTSDWGDMEAYLWKGRLRIISKGEKCFIRLEDGGTGELFAQSPYNPDKNSVESVRDSSRYFVLRVEDDDGRHAFIGMGFRERTEAFDFQVALQDHIKHVKIEKESAEKSKQINLEPKKNFSLKEGETISINIAVNVNVSGNNGASFDELN